MRGYLAVVGYDSPGTFGRKLVAIRICFCLKKGKTTFASKTCSCMKQHGIICNISS